MFLDRQDTRGPTLPPPAELPPDREPPASVGKTVQQGATRQAGRALCNFILVKKIMGMGILVEYLVKEVLANTQYFSVMCVCCF